MVKTVERRTARTRGKRTSRRSHTRRSSKGCKQRIWRTHAGLCCLRGFRGEDCCCWRYYIRSVHISAADHFPTRRCGLASLGYLVSCSARRDPSSDKWRLPSPSVQRNPPLLKVAFKLTETITSTTSMGSPSILRPHGSSRQETFESFAKN